MPAATRRSQAKDPAAPCADPAAAAPPPPPLSAPPPTAASPPASPSKHKRKPSRSRKKPAAAAPSVPPPAAPARGGLPVAAILETKTRKNGKALFRVRWAGFEADTDSWLTSEELVAAGEKARLARFEGREPSPERAAAEHERAPAPADVEVVRKPNRKGANIRFKENISRKQQNAATGDWFEEESFINDGPSALDDS